MRAYAVCIGVTPECRRTESEDEADEAYHDTCLQRAVNKLLWPLIGIAQLPIWVQHRIVGVSVPANITIRSSHYGGVGGFAYFFFGAPRQ